MRYSVRRRADRGGKSSAVAVLALVVGATLGTTAGVANAAAGPSPNSSPSPAASAGLTAALRADLTQYLDTQGTTDHFSALSLRVTYPSTHPALAVSAGTTTYGGSTPVSDNALWQIGSNTKAFTSVVILQLEAEGKLSIHDTLGKWLPQYPAWRNITIEQLLSMTSGIPDDLGQDFFANAIQANPAQNFTLTGLIDSVVNLPLGPNTYSYSNTNYMLAQLIIERATHDSYFDQVAKRILVPLGLHDTCFAPETCPPSVASRMPTGYSTSADLPALLDTSVPKLAGTWAQAAGGLVSSLQDMTTWDRALYGGRELPAKQQRELESLISITTSEPITTVTPEDPIGYGLGVAQRTDPVTGVTWSYVGEGIGYRVLHAYFPSSGLLIAIAVNSAVDSDTLPDFADTVYQTLSAWHQQR